MDPKVAAKRAENLRKFGRAGGSIGSKLPRFKTIIFNEQVGIFNPVKVFQKMQGDLPNHISKKEEADMNRRRGSIVVNNSNKSPLNNIAKENLNILAVLKSTIKNKPVIIESTQDETYDKSGRSKTYRPSKTETSDYSSD